MENIKIRLMEELSKAESIVITSHIGLDGDGYCSALALQRIISFLGKNSVIVTDNDNLNRYDYLQDGKVQEKRFSSLNDKERTFSLAIALDCNSYDRLGDRRVLIDNSITTIVLDHHQQENGLIEADLCYIDPSFACVGELVFSLLEEEINKMPFPDRIFVCNCLYTTILNDTNNFANANTDAEVLNFAAKLVDLGIQPHKLYQNFFLNQSAEEMRYVGQTLSTIELYHQRQILVMHSTYSMSKENHIDPDSIMNVTRWVQGVKGIQVIVYLREDKENVYKISLRSETVDVNKIAVRYGGGGHKQASGCNMYGDIEEIKAKLLKDIIDACNG